MGAMKQLAEDICIACYPNDVEQQDAMMVALALGVGDPIDLRECIFIFTAIREFYEREGVWPLIGGEDLERVQRAVDFRITRPHFEHPRLHHPILWQ